MNIFVCSKCDAQHQKWSGRCLECGAWGTLKEAEEKKAARKKVAGIPAAVVTFSDINGASLERLAVPGFPAGKIFPHGFPLGAIVLMAGEPGSGKSTLALELARDASQKARVLYISAEESAEQLKEHSRRIGAEDTKILVADTSSLEEAAATIHAQKPQLVIIDSLQTLRSSETEGEIGSINQVKVVTATLAQLARTERAAIVAIGHVTKDGALAGPKSLEHLVDAVYYLESEPKTAYRLLRCFKNRYGESGTVLVLQMTSAGLKEVKDAATIFIHNYADRPGSALTVTAIADQLFFIEVQALVSKSSFGYAKRTSSGFSKSRLELLLAIMKKRLHVDFDAYDVFVNIAGGFHVHEPALDLAVAVSILSSLKEEPVGANTVMFGEIGLGGELRIVRDTSVRLKEVAKHGFSKAIVPKLDKKVVSPLNVISCETLAEVVKHFGW